VSAQSEISNNYSWQPADYIWK